MKLVNAFLRALRPERAPRIHASTPLGWWPLVVVAGLLGAGATGCTNDAFCFTCEPGQGGAGGGAQGGSGAGIGGGDVCQTKDDCAAAEACCAERCADLQTSLKHCGECDHACEDGPNGAALCDKGKCTFSCETGFGDCNLLAFDGCEIDLSVDPTHCGDCDTVCLFANALPQCNGGQCALGMCKPGFDNCNGLPEDGCEVNLGTDPENCMTCGNACPTPPNAKPDCLAGTCAFGGCLVGFGDCDGDLGNGCETNLLIDGLNCGTCGYICPDLPHATPTCKDAFCGIGTCDPGYDDCDASTFDGCETELATDEAHCGMCGNACPGLAHAFAECQASTCVIGGCEAGFADCDGLVANGCEVDLSADPLNCGVCANICPDVANGQPGCAGFVCGIGSCDAGFDDCFGGATDGCETNLMTDVSHCSACGNVCPAVPFGQKACVNAMCAIGQCAPNHEDCNGVVADGCETDTTNDEMNCGGCGTVCLNPPHATAACEGSACVLDTCDAGYSDCDGNAANGCEFDTLSDANNCGGCGIKCASGSCMNAACVCQMTVLVLPDDSTTGTATLTTALTNAGYTVTTAAVPSYQYNGTNPAPTGFGTVVVLTGGPGASFSTDMPVAGQTALVNHVTSTGAGLVLTEWAAYHVASGRWQTLAPLVLLNRTVAYTGQVSYAVDPAFAMHPVWAGLPASFTFASTSNVGITKLLPNVSRIAGSPQAIDAVAIRDAPVGRVVHIAHAGNYAPNGWSNTNVQKLVANAVGWAARCN